ncbi:MAG TPA: hypothetical protein VFP12_00560 [Allosphingosinicella sp.]|nr:hypothetical protein [Allosphingosinicella sp.]
MSAEEHAGKKARTSTVTVRLPQEFLAELGVEAAARHQSLRRYIADRLMGREEPPYPALAALALMIEIAERLRRHPGAASQDVTRLEQIVRRLSEPALAELRRDR